VIDAKRSEKVQQIKVALDEPRSGTVAVTARAYPQVEYGDAIQVEGIVSRPSKVNAQYLAKDAIFASMNFPNIEIKRHNDGNRIKQYLFGIRRNSVATYERILVPDEAALLAGITLGERANFDKEFTRQMKQSGTTHLVALSGYNISIIAMMILSGAGLLLKGGAKFWAAFAVIVLFVIMAGAEASAVRAAIMGSIVLLAQYIGRAHSMRNAIAVSAVAMVLWSPNVLRFDLGFQLSFMALIGIVYVKPHIDVLIKRGKAGIMEWRENLSGTMAAQLAVFPVIMHQIGSFSLTALLSNVLVLVFIPITMWFGFVIGVLGFFSLQLASILSPLVSVLLQYEIGVIRIFGSHPGLTMTMSIGAVLLYYVIGGSLILYLQKRRTCRKNSS
jgi:competence protein ComEC